MYISRFQIFLRKCKLFSKIEVVGTTLSQSSTSLPSFIFLLYTLINNYLCSRKSKSEDNAKQISKKSKKKYNFFSRSGVTTCWKRHDNDANNRYLWILSQTRGRFRRGHPRWRFLIKTLKKTWVNFFKTFSLHSLEKISLEVRRIL